MTPMGITKIVITTANAVPTIIGSTPVVSGIEEIFLGIVETKCHYRPLQLL